MFPIHYFDADINHDADFSALMDTLHHHHITMHILAPCGPAGGNPYVRFLGSYDNVLEFRTAEKFNSDLHPIQPL